MSAAAIETSKDPVYESCYKDRPYSFGGEILTRKPNEGQLKVI